jgi:hypothetical protein
MRTQLRRPYCLRHGIRHGRHSAAQLGEGWLDDSLEVAVRLRSRRVRHHGWCEPALRSRKGSPGAVTLAEWDTPLRPGGWRTTTRRGPVAGTARFTPGSIVHVLRTRTGCGKLSGLTAPHGAVSALTQIADPTAQRGLGERRFTVVPKLAATPGQQAGCSSVAIWSETRWPLMAAAVIGAALK